MGSQGQKHGAQMMRISWVLGLCLLLAGCGMMARKEREEQMQAAMAARDQGFAACKLQFPDGSRQWVAKNACEARAAQVIRPYVSYPDLFDKQWAYSATVAERLQAGKLTLAEANQQITEEQSRVTAEEQQRNLSARSVGAQESAAAAAWQAATPDTPVVFVNPGTGRRF